MRKEPIVGAVLVFTVLIILAAGTNRAAAQGPAGAGAAAAAQEGSRSYNPLNWVKRDSKGPTDGPAFRSEVEQKITPVLQAQGLLAANDSATGACAAFTTLVECLAVLHASHNMGLDFNCLRAGVTGVLTNADVTGCKVAATEKAQALERVIHQVKPEANAKQVVKEAEQQAMEDLKGVGA